MSERYDLAIIGGGINGAAVAELAAGNGYRVALLEKTDFGAGVTSRSTRLIHGGLRYLEQGRVSVVRESLRERDALLDEFPHQVRALPFLIPVYRGDSRARLWIRIGLEAYQFIGGSRLLDRHRQLSRSEVLALEPGLKADGLSGGFLYYDCQSLYPERLALEMALRAERYGATVENHTPVTQLFREDGAVAGVQVEDGRRYRAWMVLNAAGPWADQVRRMGLDGREGGRPLLTLLSGAHIVTDAFPGGPRNAIYHEASGDRRPFFVIPWRGLWLIGTTETPHQGDPGEAAPTAAEIDYLLTETNRLFPRAGLGRPAVLYAYAGVRPLLRSEGRSAQEISRGHAIYDHQSEEGVPGMITLVGGKLTTARAFAAQVLQVVAARLGRPTAPRRLRPERNGVAAPTRLAEIYGRAAEAILALGPELDRPICSRSPTTVAEVVHAIRREKARTLGDILLRRTGVAFGPCMGLDCAPEAARIAAPLLGWDDAVIAAAIDHYRRELDQTLHR